MAAITGPLERPSEAWSGHYFYESAARKVAQPGVLAAMTKSLNATQIRFIVLHCTCQVLELLLLLLPLALPLPLLVLL